MQISASIKNELALNEITVSTEGSSKKIIIPSKPDGNGSSVNGGELLFLSLATCFCNDVYREAVKRNMKVKSVEVKVDGEFGKPGEPGTNISYQVEVDAPEHSAAEIELLIQHVDNIAEIHKTLRQGASVVLKKK
jgi:uncharacterized OsmC-like protein